MDFIVLLGRILYSAIFILASFGHFTQGSIQFAEAQGLPFAMILVPFSGVLSLLGGLSILLGYKAKWGAWALVLFLIPVSLIMHQFWGEKVGMNGPMQTAMFMKNMALLGCAFMITYFGSGPLSLKR